MNTTEMKSVYILDAIKNIVSQLCSFLEGWGDDFTKIIIEWHDKEFRVTIVPKDLED